MPFLPLYVEQLALPDHSAPEYVVGIVFSITFYFRPSPLHRFGVDSPTVKDRKIMLLRSALGMGIVMVLMGLAQNIWQFFDPAGASWFTWRICPNANALIATNYRVIKRLGAGYASPQAALAARCSANGWRFCSPIATAYVRYSLLPPVCSYSAFRHPVLHQRKFQPVSKRDAAYAGSGDIT